MHVAPARPADGHDCTDICCNRCHCEQVADVSDPMTTSFVQAIKAGVKAEQKVARVRALLGDEDGPLWSVRGVREEDIRKALKETT